MLTSLTEKNKNIRQNLRLTKKKKIFITQELRINNHRAFELRKFQILLAVFFSYGNRPISRVRNILHNKLL